MSFVCVVANLISICVSFMSNQCGRSVEDVTIHGSTHIPQYSLNTVEMSVMWTLHELAKEADQIAEVGSGDAEVH